MKKNLRFPRRLKKALKKLFSIDPNAITLRYRGKWYFVTMLKNGRLFIDRPFYDAPAPISLQELSLSSLIEERLYKLLNFPYYE